MSAPNDGTVDLPARFLAHVRGHRLIAPGASVIVALSGGLDSVVLLHLLRFHGPPGLRLHAAHLDHAMRMGSADDAAWVRGLCAAWDVQVTVARARRAPDSETKARTLRHRFLASTRCARGADLVVMAHHADDQAETVLFRALRGTGTRGLGGMRARRGRLVRPLLTFTRAELASYASAHGLSWRDDPGNLDRRYARNRLRHDVLPTLEAAWPGAARALARLADHARLEERAWDRMLRDLLRECARVTDDGVTEVARDRLLGYHPHVRARLLRRVLRRYGSRPDRAGTRAALEFISTGSSGAALHVAGGVRIERAFDRIRIGRAVDDRAAERALVIGGPGAGTGVAVVGGRTWHVRWGAGGNGGVAVAFDPATLRFPLVLRSWRPGDRIRLRGGSRKLKKLFGDRRIARSRRAQLPVLADGDGRVLWVAGVARSAELHPAPRGAAFHLDLSDVEPA